MKQYQYESIKRAAKGTATKVTIITIAYHSAMKPSLDEYRVRLVNSEVVETSDYNTALENIR